MTPEVRMGLGTRLVVMFVAVLGLSRQSWVGTEQRIDPKAGCRRNPAIVGPCFTVHGRLFASNGSPGVRIWPVGTNRILGVLLNEAEIMPAVLHRHLNWDTRIYGDFEVCPFTPEKAGQMRFVCVESASKLVGERFVEGQREPHIFRIR